MSDLPISRITLFSSGVGFFEPRGSIDGTVEITLPFNVEAVNDVLKSLVINDPAGCPIVSYPSEEMQDWALSGLSVNIENSSLVEMLDDLKGAEIEVKVPDLLKGKILFAERRNQNINNVCIQKENREVY